MEYSLELLTNNLKHATCSHTCPYVLQMPHVLNWCFEYINSIYTYSICYVYLSWINVAGLIVHIIYLMNHSSIWETNRSAWTLFKILSDLIARSTTLQLVWLCLKINVLHTQTFSHSSLCKSAITPNLCLWKHKRQKNTSKSCRVRRQNVGVQ